METPCRSFSPLSRVYSPASSESSDQDDSRYSVTRALLAGYELKRSASWKGRSPWRIVQMFSLLTVTLLLVWIGWLRALRAEDWRYTRLEQLSTLPHLPPVETPRVHLLVPINEKEHKRAVCESLSAAINAGYSPTLINWDFQGTVGEAHLAKITGVTAFLNSTDANESDLVLMIDAFDVWLQLSPRALARRLTEFKSEVLVGPDECYPNSRDSPACRDAPASPMPKALDMSHLRFVNSGNIAGSVRGMRELYSHVHALMLGEKHGYSDQYYFNQLIREDLFEIDYGYRLFMTTAPPARALIMPLRHPIDGDVHDKQLPLEHYPPMIINQQTGEMPVLIHVNQDKVYWHDEVLHGRTWWTMSRDSRFSPIILERLRGGRINFAHNNTVVPYFDLCPMMADDLLS